MSVCRFLASDTPLLEYAPARDYPISIDIDTGILDDGGADDNYFLFPFPEVADYTPRNYGVVLEWNYTEGRAKRIISYIKAALQSSPQVELWHVWLTDYYEFEDRPFIHRQSVSIEQLTPAHIKEIDDAVIWNKPDKMYPNRPSFYCLTIHN